MSLYDDMDAKQKSEQVAGWSSGIKLLQSQLQLRKAVQTQPKREALRKSGVILAPVIDLKSKKDDEDSNSNSSFGSYSGKDAKGVSQLQSVPRDSEWNVEGEYDPMWPNDYEKVVKDLREIREREKEKEEEEKRRKSREDREKRARERFEGTEERRQPKPTGFAGRKDSDEEEEEKPTTPRAGGVAIAPPPSLQEASLSPEAPKMPSVSGEKYGLSFGGSVAAKIMAKYGFKEGQGLGKQEQGISMALQVEKTSKRGGRIISEKEIMPPPPAGATVGSPAASSQIQPPKPEPSITEIMKTPAKVVLLRNMVGPGEVDEDLEPEVKDECNNKYGDVVRVIIFEQPNVSPEEAVRIFVEFKRIESAIKAVVDLNGRFFGGRQVKAGFYSWEKLNNLQLLD